MALKYANIDKLEEDLTAIADTLRAKDGSNEELIFPNDFITKVNKLHKINDFADLNKPEGELYSTATSLGWTHYLWKRKGITSLNFPNLTSIQDYAFSECSGITQVNLSNCTTINNMGLNKTAISYLVLPKGYYLNTNAVSECTHLVGADLGGQIPSSGTSGIGAYAFSKDSKIVTLILRSSTLVNLININAFAYTPFASGNAGGTLYVPEDLIEDYQNATNWSTILSYTKNNQLQNQILAIENSIYTTKYIDGSVIE